MTSRVRKFKLIQFKDSKMEEGRKEGEGEGRGEKEGEGSGEKEREGEREGGGREWEE